VSKGGRGQLKARHNVRSSSFPLNRLEEKEEGEGKSFASSAEKDPAVRRALNERVPQASSRGGGGEKRRIPLDSLSKRER